MDLQAVYNEVKKTVPIDCTTWDEDAVYWEGQMFKYGKNGVWVYHFLAFDVFWMVIDNQLIPCSSEGSA